MWCQHPAISAGCPDTVRHEPCRLEADPKRTVKLVAAHALLAAGHKEDRLQPHIQRDMAGFKDGPHLHGKGLAAVPALVDANPGALAFQLLAIPDYPALGAYGTLRPKAGFHEFICGQFVMEVSG